MPKIIFPSKIGALTCSNVPFLTFDISQAQPHFLCTHKYMNIWIYVILPIAVIDSWQTLTLFFNIFHLFQVHFLWIEWNGMEWICSAKLMSDLQYALAVSINTRCHTSLLFVCLSMFQVSWQQIWISGCFH